MDLGAALWGPLPLGVRRLNSLVGCLPMDSATARVLDPDRTGAGWDAQTELVALLCELVDTNTRLHYDMNKKKGAKSPRPLFIPRPWHRRKTKRRATSRETRALFGAGAVIVPRPKE